MATPMDVPQDVEADRNRIGGSRIGEDNPFSDRPPVVSTRRIRVRGVYILGSPSDNNQNNNRRPAVQGQAEQPEERQAVAVIRRKKQYQRSPPRFCYCFLMLPFLVALAALVLSVTTFTIKNEEIKRKCSNITCTLSCGEGFRDDCWVIVGAGASVCLVTGIYILSLVIRTCTGSKL